jgi:uncharacterized protein (DUF4415 family)
MTKSKTQQALELLRNNPDMKPYQAADAVGVQNAAVYQALQRIKGKEQCPCCNQVVRAGFEVIPNMIKVDADLYEALVAAGEGWQERLNDGLRKLKDITA